MSNPPTSAQAATRPTTDRAVPIDVSHTDAQLRADLMIGVAELQELEHIALTLGGILEGERHLIHDEVAPTSRSMC